MLKILLTSITLIILPALSFALCLTECRQGTSKPIISNDNHSVGYKSDEVNYRERSHNTGDVKNSVMGDMNIRIGHERLDIRMDSNSSNNSVDASISSTIILGDMKK